MEMALSPRHFMPGAMCLDYCIAWKIENAAIPPRSRFGASTRSLRRAAIPRAAAHCVVSQITAGRSRKLLAGPHLVAPHQRTTKYPPAKNRLDFRPQISRKRCRHIAVDVTVKDGWRVVGAFATLGLRDDPARRAQEAEARTQDVMVARYPMYFACPAGIANRDHTMCAESANRRIDRPSPSKTWGIDAEAHTRSAGRVVRDRGKI